MKTLLHGYLFNFLVNHWTHYYLAGDDRYASVFAAQIEIELNRL